MHTRWKVVAVADNIVSSEGLAAIVRRSRRFFLCAATPTRTGVHEMLARHRPDLVIIEEPLTMSEDEFEWIALLTAAVPEARLLIVSRHADSAYAERACRAGASAAFARNGSADALVNAMKAALTKPATNPHTRLGVASLSDRELEVFALLGSGYGITEIARQLGISRKTVETHCEHVKLKLGFKNVHELKRGARRAFGHA
jgi:DNA-binding NarL/FixJ family response regulator